MDNQYNYVTKLDVKFEHQQLIDVSKMVETCTDKWFNQTLTKVNDSVVRTVNRKTVIFRRLDLRARESVSISRR